MYRYLFALFASFSLCAKEPFIAILKNINSNEIQKFGYGNYTFFCEPYGVVGLDLMYERSKKDSVCRVKIDEFYKKNPKLKNFAIFKLYVEQSYHIEFKKQKCILYANGQITLSEMLLKEGLAVVEVNFLDDEFSYSFKQAQLAAKLQKKGLWNTTIQKSCIASTVNQNP